MIAMHQRSTIGSSTSSAQVPNGTPTAMATDSGSTSRQLQRRVSGMANGMVDTKSASRMLTAAIRGS
jgi:hypothetical protein